MTRHTCLPRLVVLLLVPTIPGYWGHGQNDRRSSSLLTNITDRYWMWKLQQFPSTATARGIHQFDDQLEDFSLQAVGYRKDMAVEVLGQLEGLHKADLSTTEVHTLEVLRADLNYYVDGYKYRLYGYLNPISFLEGPHRRLGWISYQPSQTQTDYAKLIKRYQAYIRQVDQVIVLMRKAVRLRRTNHRVSMGAVVSTLDRFVGGRPNESFFYRPFMAEVGLKRSIDDNTWWDLRTEGLRVVSEGVFPALRRLRDFIAHVYMKATRPSYGVSSFSGGADYYEACLRFHLTINITAREVRDIGLRQVASIKAQMEAIMRREGFQGSLPQFFKYLRTHRRQEFFDRSQAELLQSYRRIIHEVIPPKLPTVLKTIPTDPVRVKPMSESRLVAMYAPAGDGGIFYVNTGDTKSRPTFTQMALALHETNPGHHLQVMYSQKQPIPEFRRQLCCLRYGAVPLAFQWYSAYTEGWGLYAEFLGEEMGCYNRSTLELFGRYSFEMLRACRLVLDTGLHVYGWSRDKAIDYLTDHTAMTQIQAEQEVDRYITWPGQACAYKIGEIVILKLRRHAEKVLGAAFDPREFNDQVLQLGRAPLYLLERHISSWLDSAGSPAASAGGRTTQVPPSSYLILSVCTLIYCIGNSLKPLRLSRA